MNTLGKWLARAGGLIIVVGFLMPFFSYQGLAVSLSNLAELPLTALKTMYFVPLGGVLVILCASIPTKSRTTAILFLVGQVGSLIIAALPVLGLLGYIISEASNAAGSIGVNIDFTDFLKVLGFGFYGLMIAYILTAVSLVLQMVDVYRAGAQGSYGGGYQPAYGGGYYSPQDYNAPGRYEPTVSGGYGPPSTPSGAAVAPAQGAFIEITGGGLPPSQIPLYDNFTIGRSRQNSLQIPDSRVSRQHARLRYAQGSWFIQDMDSAAGTYVNGQLVSAGRLAPGDQITIGSTTIVFWM